MASEVLVAIVTAIGSSTVVGSLIAALFNRRRNSVEVTEILNRMSKDALLDAENVKGELRQIRAILTDLVRLIETEVLPALPEQHVETRARLRALSSRAKEVA